MDLFFYGLIILGILAVMDLMFGVSNDAVNFLNSSFGSRVASRRVIMIIASAGILAGVLFSSGMMEVARKGIFHPQFFTMPELMTIFLGVMLTDILLLDFFNTFGLPTSTTVSIVFELLGGAVALTAIKLIKSDQGLSHMMDYINTSKALVIISGILLSVIIAFMAGALLQFLSRLWFTFDYKTRLKRYGALWGGLALSAIVFFILIKGAKGASFIHPETLAWIKEHTFLLLVASFLFFTLLFQLLISLSRINILKIIILVGTFALALAFAANDLVNFIGVPVAGLNSYRAAAASGSPLTTPMTALQEKVPTHTLLLLLAGLIMVATLWISRKARTVTKTEMNLGRQEAGMERFGSSPLSRTIVRFTSGVLTGVKKIIPQGAQDWVSSRFDYSQYQPERARDGRVTHFDLFRASVNLVVASILISIATSMKLPLSTTYVTFMVAMGTSLADRAWGNESAVYRITGVLTVIGGWFFTALTAFTCSGIIALLIYSLKGPAVIAIFVLIMLTVLYTHRFHKKKESEEKKMEIFNLRKIDDTRQAITQSFTHASLFLQRVKEVLDETLDALIRENYPKLKIMRGESSKIQNWANVLVANIYKILRLMGQEDTRKNYEYSNTINHLQGIAESLRDIILRSTIHIGNNHKGLLKVQAKELTQIKQIVEVVIGRTLQSLGGQGAVELSVLDQHLDELLEMRREFNRNQIGRIQDLSSKTRLSILFYGLLRDFTRVARHTRNLAQVFGDFSEIRKIR